MIFEKCQVRGFRVQPDERIRWTHSEVAHKTHERKQMFLCGDLGTFHEALYPLPTSASKLNPKPENALQQPELQHAWAPQPADGYSADRMSCFACIAPTKQFPGRGWAVGGGVKGLQAGCISHWTHEMGTALDM